MSGATYALWLRSPTGILIAPGVLFASLEWARAENTFGWLKADLLPDFDTRLLALDSRLEIHRTIGGRTYNEGGTQYLLRWWRFAEDERGHEVIQIEAYDLNYLLSGPIVAYEASTDTVTNPYSTKTGAADNLMKAIVRENLGSLATVTARQLTELTVQADLSLAPSTSKSFSRRRVLDVLQDLARDAFQQGTYLAFDLTANSSGTGLTFATYTGQRGQNHSAGGGQSLIVSKANGNLMTPELIYDHRNERTVVYCGGLGQGGGRVVVTAEDSARCEQSPFARRELWVDGRNTDNVAVLNADARSELQLARPMRTFTGRLIDTEGVRYGVHLGFGDVVTAEYRGASYDCHLARVHGKVIGKKETLEINLVSEALI